jgi:hypothetical protein
MMNAFADMLQSAGARPPRYGRKWDCGACGGKGSLSVDLEKGLFNCFHAGCAFRGGISALRARLGIPREWLPRDVYLRQQQERERANRRARVIADRIRDQRLKLHDQLRRLNHLERCAHAAGPDHIATWGTLALVYRERPQIEVALDWLETSASDLLKTQSG